jgi:hypothetical protein
MKTVILSTFLGSLFTMNAAIATTAPCQSFTGTINITNDSLAELTSGGTQYLLEMSSFPYLGQSIAAAGNYMADVKGYSNGQKVTINAAVESGVINYGESLTD